MENKFYDKERIEEKIRALIRKRRQTFLEDIPTVDCVNSFPGGFSLSRRQRILAQVQQSGMVFANCELLDAIMQHDSFVDKYLEFSRLTGNCRKTAALIQEVLDAYSSPHKQVSKAVKEESQERAILPSGSTQKFQHSVTHAKQSEKLETLAKGEEPATTTRYLLSKHADVAHPTEEGASNSNNTFSSKSVLGNLCQSTPSDDESSMGLSERKEERCENGYTMKHDSPKNEVYRFPRKDDNDDNKNRNRNSTVKPVGEKRLSFPLHHDKQVSEQPQVNDEEEEDSRSFYLSDTEINNACPDSTTNVSCLPEIDSLKCKPETDSREVSVKNGLRLDDKTPGIINGTNKIDMFQQVEQSSNGKLLNCDHAIDTLKNVKRDKSYKIMNAPVKSFPDTDNQKHSDRDVAVENRDMSGAYGASNIDHEPVESVAGDSESGNDNNCNSPIYNNCVIITAGNVQMDTKNCNIKSNQNPKKSIQHKLSHEKESLMPQTDLTAGDADNTGNKHDCSSLQTVADNPSESVQNIDNYDDESENEDQSNQDVYPDPDRPSFQTESSFHDDVTYTTATDTDDLRELPKSTQEVEYPSNSLLRNINSMIPGWLKFEWGFSSSFS